MPDSGTSTNPVLRSLIFCRDLLTRINADNVHDLSTRQLTLLLHVYTTPPPHRVRDLARELRFTKPSVTRCLDRLESCDLVGRKSDARDGRSVLIQRTLKGTAMLHRLSELITATFPAGQPNPADDADNQS